MDDVRILMVDDDVELCELLTDYLGQEGYDVSAVHDAEAGLARALEGSFALVILDVMLPGGSGLDVLRRLRTTSTVPVLMLTARGEEVDRIVGLELGADDYLGKPFNPRELVARVRAIQRRSAPKGGGGDFAPEVLVVGDVELDVGARRVLRAGVEIQLTSAEITLLELFMRAAGHVVERDVISEKVLGRRLSPFDRSIDVHVSNLRKKLATTPDARELIKTVRGSGYQYVTG